MSATTAGAVKAAAEALGLGLVFYRDSAPNGAPLPYGTITEAVVVTADRDGDEGDPNRRGTVREDVQVDLWQTWRGPDGKVVESYSLPLDLARGLHRAKLQTVNGRRVYGVSRPNVVRLLEQSENIVHHAVTLTVHREE